MGRSNSHDAHDRLGIRSETELKEYNSQGIVELVNNFESRERITRSKLMVDRAEVDRVVSIWSLLRRGERNVAGTVGYLEEAKLID
jgi:hypothetical protein